MKMLNVATSRREFPCWAWFVGLQRVPSCTALFLAQNFHFVSRNKESMNQEKKRKRDSQIDG